MPSNRDQLYGELVLEEDEAEKYRDVAIQLVKRYSEAGKIDRIVDAERLGSEVIFEAERYKIRTSSVPLEGGRRKMSIAADTRHPREDQIFEELGSDITRTVDELLS